MDAAFVVALAAAAEATTVLDLDTRRRVHDTIARHPGLHLSGVAQEAGLEINHVKYHARVLTKHGLVKQREDGERITLWPTKRSVAGAIDAVDPDDRRVLAWLRRPVPLQLVLHLLDEGPMTLGELAPRMGLARGTLHHHVKGLLKENILETLEDGRRRPVAVRDADHVMQLLMAHRPPDKLVAGFLDAWEAVRL